MTSITIPGKPFGKQRPRSTRTGRMYTPAQTVHFEAIVRDIGLIAFPAPLQGPVRVEIVATFEVPKSCSKAERAARLYRPHTMKPDLDNCQKAILDGLNRVAFADDAQVAEIKCRKLWGDTAQTVVWVEAI